MANKEPVPVHIKRKNGVIVQDCTCYVGRRLTMGGWNLKTSKWANPFVIRSADNDTISGLSSATNKEKIAMKKEFDIKERKRVLEAYESYVRDNQNLMNSLGELTGQTLGCFCLDKVKRPTPDTLICHAEVLVKLWREKYGAKTDN